MDQSAVDQIGGNGHIEPCRDLKQLKVEVVKIKQCVDELKSKSVPRWVFVLFVGGLVGVSVAFITWHVSAIKTITFEASNQQDVLYEKIDQLRSELVDLKVQQATFNTKFNTIQEQVIRTLQQTRENLERDRPR